MHPEDLHPPRVQTTSAGSTRTYGRGRRPGSRGRLWSAPTRRRISAWRSSAGGYTWRSSERPFRRETCSRYGDSCSSWGGIRERFRISSWCLTALTGRWWRRRSSPELDSWRRRLCSVTVGTTRRSTSCFLIGPIGDGKNTLLLSFFLFSLYLLKFHHSSFGFDKWNPIITSVRVALVLYRAEVNIKPWESLLKELREGNQRSKWVDREPYAYWKGNPTVADTRLDLMKCNLSEGGYDWKARLYQQVIESMPPIFTNVLVLWFNYLTSPALHEMLSGI